MSGYLMCGICGIVRFNKWIRKDEIESMKNAMNHRGPDDEGTYISSPTQTNSKCFIGLGHRRLSIIDLSDIAKQPMCNENRNIWLTYNGEIYNYLELRKELISYGHIFKSNSDTEVIIHAYEEWGFECLQKFNGMFAFAIWNESKNELFLARDRLGIKPLYYYSENDSFIFASELKSVICVKDIKKELDKDSIIAYLALQYIPTPKTIFKKIKKLEPGHFLLLSNRTLRKKRYWRLDYSTKTDWPVTKIQGELRSLLDDSVKKRMISDVPVGAFLSGGIDSSIIVGLMSEQNTSPIKTFSIGFDSEEYQSELKYARIISKKYATNHHEEILSAEDLLYMLSDLVWYMDEPFADHSMVPTFLVSKLARRHVTVVLTGDGADENFAGYPRQHKFAKALEQYDRLPDYIKSWLEKKSIIFLKKSIKTMYDNNIKRKILRLIDMLDKKGLERIVALESVLTTPLRNKILITNFPELQNYNNIYSSPVIHRHSDYLESKLLFDIQNYLVDDILTKIDRMSMANSLEARVPFLDHRVVELSAKIPTSLKLFKGQTKYILKHTFKDDLPRDILVRKKKGFGIPIQFWGKSRLSEYLKDMLNSKFSKESGIFNKREIIKMIDLTADGRCDFSRELWCILMFELWYNCYC